MLNFEFSYPFYLTERTRHVVYTSTKVQQELEKTTLSSTSVQLLVASIYGTRRKIVLKMVRSVCVARRQRFPKNGVKRSVPFRSTVRSVPFYVPVGSVSYFR